MEHQGLLGGRAFLVYRDIGAGLVPHHILSSRARHTSPQGELEFLWLAMKMVGRQSTNLSWSRLTHLSEVTSELNRTVYPRGPRITDLQDRTSRCCCEGHVLAAPVKCHCRLLLPAFRAFCTERDMYCKKGASNVTAAGGTPPLGAQPVVVPAHPRPRPSTTP